MSSERSKFFSGVIIPPFFLIKKASDQIEQILF